MEVRRKSLLREVMLRECATALLTQVFDGVLERLEERGEASLTESESTWLHEQIGGMADRFLVQV